MDGIVGGGSGGKGNGGDGRGGRRRGARRGPRSAGAAPGPGARFPRAGRVRPRARLRRSVPCWATRPRDRDLLIGASAP